MSIESVAELGSIVNSVKTVTQRSEDQEKSDYPQVEAKLNDVISKMKHILGELQDVRDRLGMKYEKFMRRFEDQQRGQLGVKAVRGRKRTWKRRIYDKPKKTDDQATYTRSASDFTDNCRNIDARVMLEKTVKCKLKENSV